MYTFSDVIELGTAQEVILSQIKVLLVLDDSAMDSFIIFPPWDE